MITKDFVIPTFEELEVEEVNLSTASLRAGSFHLGKHCENANNEFILCKDENNHDPRKCLNEGKEVTACSLDFFRQVKKVCKDEFMKFATCLDQTSSDFAFKRCRKTQAVYDMCMLEKMSLDRPEYGYFCRVHIHDSKRPKPPRELKTLYEDAVPSLPADAPRPPARLGSRYYWLND